MTFSYLFQFRKNVIVYICLKFQYLQRKYWVSKGHNQIRVCLIRNHLSFCCSFQNMNLYNLEEYSFYKTNYRLILKGCFTRLQSSRCTLYDAKTYNLHIGYPVGYFGQASHTSHTHLMIVLLHLRGSTRYRY